MGFWSFIRDVFVLDWLFGHRKKESFWERSQRESRHYDNHSSCDEYGGSGYSHYHHNDYAQQDFDDDLDSGVYEDL